MKIISIFATYFHIAASIRENNNLKRKKMNVMQTTAKVMMAAMIAVSVQAVSARRSNSTPTVVSPKATDTVVVYRTDTVYINNVSEGDGELNEAAQITNSYQFEAYKLKLSEEKQERIRKDEADSYRRKIDDDSHKNWDFYSLLSSYFFLLLFGVALPVLVVFLYLNYSKRRQQRYEMLIDLMRSGVDIKPELLDVLSPSLINLNWRVAIPKTDKAMTAQHYTYCLKRVVWALACLLIGVAFSVIANKGIFFGFGVVVAVVLLMQAAIRYFSLSYISKNMAAGTQSNNAENIVNNIIPSTADNNAQQP